jgi:hypothetical protein
MCPVIQKVCEIVVINHRNSSLPEDNINYSQKPARLMNHPFSDGFHIAAIKLMVDTY